ncbi:MAG: hypothetical protein N3G79_05500 [Sulfolobales archaeon]|nr:hypothetical protein [Sulfolobales archaeon]
MVNLRYALALLQRAVPGLVFIDIAVRALSIAPELLSAGPTALSAELFLVAASGFLAVLSIATGSPAIYSVTLALLVVSELPISLQSAAHRSLALRTGYLEPVELDYLGGIRVPIAGIAGLFLVLAFDAYSTAYRHRKREVSTNLREVLKAFTAFLTVLVPFVSASVALGIYYTSLLELLRESSQKVSAEFLRVLTISPVTHVVVAAVLLYVLIRLVDSSVDTLIPFLAPSRKISLSFLLEKKNLDRVFTPPLLGTVLGLAAVLFYPAIHVILFDVLVELPTLAPAGLELVLRVFENVASLLVTSLIAYGIVDRKIVSGPSRRRVICAVAALILVYASSVKLSLLRGESLLKSLVEPDFAGLVKILEKTYSNYAYYLLTFIESLTRFLGVAP